MHQLTQLCVNKLTCVKIINAHIHVNLLNSVKQKFQHSVKLRLFDNPMNSSN